MNDGEKITLKKYFELYKDRLTEEKYLLLKFCQTMECDIFFEKKGKTTFIEFEFCNGAFKAKDSFKIRKQHLNPSLILRVFEESGHSKYDTAERCNALILEEFKKDIKDD